MVEPPFRSGRLEPQGSATRLHAVVAAVHVRENLVDSVASATGVGDFITSELLTFAIQTFLNSFFASLWPVVWHTELGVEAFYWAGGGYLVWVALLAWALSRRKKELKKELGL